ncbi:amidohydrolase family protein [Algoriphagus halophilus]|uniref:amidohydrolase family protein n=1 Tax=Algoriphagus halophilus TaxID=226505 RepID=UPI00358F6252
MKKTLLKAGVLGLLVAGWFSTNSLYAQSDPTGKKPVTSTYAITNATVITAPGSSGTKATVLIKDGVIQGVGSNLNIPSEAQVIAGDSLFIYPGFIDGGSDAGITAPKDPERPKDFVSSNPPDEIAGITPWRSAVDQFAADDKSVEDFRKAGFTVAQILPDGGMIAGKAAVVVFGSEYSTNILKTNTALVSSFRGARGMYPGTAVGVMAKFRDIFQNTKLSQGRSNQYQTASGVVRPEFNPTYQAMMEVINGQIPVMYTAPSELEVRRALSLQKELGFKLILTGLNDYANVIDVIKAANVPVLISLEIPDDKAIKAQKEEVDEATKAQYSRVQEAYDNAIKQAGLLEEAGVPFAFTTKGTKSGDVMKALSSMIEHGLSEEGALAALTTNAASVLGMSRVAGTIEKGKMANLVITTDQLFAEDSQIKHVVVDGYIFDFDTKPKKKASNGDAEGAAKVAGNWNYETESPAGSSGGTFEIVQDGSSYTGTITLDNPAGAGKINTDLEDINVNGKNLTFSFNIDAGGNEITINVSGEVEGESYDGTMSVAQFGSFPFTATLNPTLIAIK